MILFIEAVLFGMFVTAVGGGQVCIPLIRLLQSSSVGLLAVHCKQYIITRVPFVYLLLFKVLLFASVSPDNLEHCSSYLNLNFRVLT